MKNKSAVEWYAQHEIELTLEFLAKKISELDYGLCRLNLINQAKEMEHEQQERMYSEEDMNEYADYCLMCSAEKTLKIPLQPKEWFEQFKNK